jgi:hypothetical protein
MHFVVAELPCSAATITVLIRSSLLLEFLDKAQRGPTGSIATANLLVSG